MASSRPPKRKLVEQLMEQFRLSGNRDRAFDHLAAEQLGVNDTDQHCLNIIESAAGLTAGELAEAAGLSTGAVTGVVDRLERAGYARRIRDRPTVAESTSKSPRSSTPAPKRSGARWSATGRTP